MPEPHKSQHDAYLSKYAETGKGTVIGRERKVTAQKKDGSLHTVKIMIDAFSLLLCVLLGRFERYRKERQKNQSNYVLSSFFKSFSYRSILSFTGILVPRERV